MNSNTLTEVIAVIGCVTGVCSLVLNFYKILSEKPKVKLEEYKFYLNGFYDNKNETYKTKRILLINLRINNLSTSPFSLKSAILNFNNLTLRPRDNYKLTKLSFPCGTKSTHEYDVDAQLCFPLTVEPMQIINCSLIFPFADKLFDIYLENGSKPMKICVKLFAGTKCVKFKTKIFELTEENIIYHQKNNQDKLCSM